MVTPPLDSAASIMLKARTSAGRMLGTTSAAIDYSTTPGWFRILRSSGLSSSSLSRVLAHLASDIVSCGPSR